MRVFGELDKESENKDKEISQLTKALEEIIQTEDKFSQHISYHPYYQCLSIAKQALKKK